MRKTTFLVGAAIGYVLGARAGRRRYEQISALANRVWGTPQVQQAKDTATSAAAGAAKNATINLRDAAVNSAPAASVKQAASRATTAVKDRLPGSGGTHGSGGTGGPSGTVYPSTPTPASTTPTPAGTTTPAPATTPVVDVTDPKPAPVPGAPRD